MAFASVFWSLRTLACVSRYLVLYFVSVTILFLVTIHFPSQSSFPKYREAFGRVSLQVYVSVVLVYLVSKGRQSWRTRDFVQVVSRVENHLEYCSWRTEWVGTKRDTDIPSAWTRKSSGFSFFSIYQLSSTPSRVVNTRSNLNLCVTELTKAWKLAENGIERPIAACKHFPKWSEVQWVLYVQNGVINGLGDWLYNGK